MDCGGRIPESEGMEVPSQNGSSPMRSRIFALQVRSFPMRRDGRGHSVWVNSASGRQSALPRHREIGDDTARAICRQRDIPEP
jgi:hypothetical protein